MVDPKLKSKSYFQNHMKTHQTTPMFAVQPGFSPPYHGSKQRPMAVQVGIRPPLGGGEECAHAGDFHLLSQPERVTWLGAKAGEDIGGKRSHDYGWPFSIANR